MVRIPLIVERLSSDVDLTGRRATHTPYKVRQKHVLGYFQAQLHEEDWHLAVIRNDRPDRFNDVVYNNCNTISVGIKTSEYVDLRGNATLNSSTCSHLYCNSCAP